jgi:hypothetical protein
VVRPVRPGPDVAGGANERMGEPVSRASLLTPAKRPERDTSERIGLLREITMPQSNHDPKEVEAGRQVPARPHDSGSQANETVDGLDATTEALRRAAENTPSGVAPEDVENVPVFDRAGQAPKI